MSARRFPLYERWLCPQTEFMLNHKAINLLAMLLAVSATGAVQADSFRCGQKLVRTGDTTGDLLRICGAPRHKDRGEERIRIDGVNRKSRVERWYYKRSGRSLERIVLIYRGRIAGIEVGSR